MQLAPCCGKVFATGLICHSHGVLVDGLLVVVRAHICSWDTNVFLQSGGCDCHEVRGASVLRATLPGLSVGCCKGEGERPAKRPKLAAATSKAT